MVEQLSIFAQCIDGKNNEIFALLLDEISIKNGVLKVKDKLVGFVDDVSLRENKNFDHLK